ncbi:unnamed protein product, partial [Staurois parvus]
GSCFTCHSSCIFVHPVHIYTDLTHSTALSSRWCVSSNIQMNGKTQGFPAEHCPRHHTASADFLLALITVLVSLGMSVTPSQFPPVSECPPQSRYKSLIAAIIYTLYKK